jgi:hypothetical protein
MREFSITVSGELGAMNEKALGREKLSHKPRVTWCLHVVESVLLLSALYTW